MAPEHKNSDAGHSDMPRTSCKDESSLLNKERKKNHMLKLLRSVVRTCLVSMKLQKEKNSSGRFTFVNLLLIYQLNFGIGMERENSICRVQSY